MTLEQKVARSKGIITEALDRFGNERMAIAWTGHKDSTLVLWLFRLVCSEGGIRLPKCMMIDEGDVFAEVRDFMKTVTTAWDIELVEARNTDVISRARGIGDPIVVSDLNEQNRAELLRIGYTGDTFPFEPESLVGNHLLKTCAMNMFIREHGLKALATAIRRDEQSARGQESHFSDRLDNDPPHMRVHPILHFTERDVWDTIQENNIPYCGLYAQGYRSLGARYNTLKTSDLPAWDQGLETTPERAGRGQEKEQLMDRLRALGYM